MADDVRIAQPGARPAPEAGPPPAAAAVAALGREAVSAAVTAAVWPFGVLDRGLARAGAELLGRPTLVSTPVLLVHGYAANKSHWLFVQRQLRDAGFGQVHALNCNPFRHDIPTMGAQVADRGRTLMARLGATRVHVIGHSMGGLVARWAVQVEGLAASTCVTVASPHGGAPLARVGLGPAARDMVPGSVLLRRLAATAGPNRYGTRYVAYWSELDAVVPGRRAQLVDPQLRATNVRVPGEGHLSIMRSRRLTASIVDQLAAAEGLAGYGRPVTSLAAAPPPAEEIDAPPERGGPPLPAFDAPSQACAPG